MSLTKKQKISLIDAGEKILKENTIAVFVGFNGVSVEDLKSFRIELKKDEADFKVVKKRLLNISLKKSGIEFDTMVAKLQVGIIYTTKDLASIASIVNNFSKKIKKTKTGEFGVIGACDIKENRLVDVEEFNIIATLPSREVLLSQIATMLTMPIKKIMFGLNEKAKKISTL
ncbi:MAG: 50S ribosomal protein L10 [Nanoarchaeota archaeon]|nr:50S ribosomal protein L10 [Patescibacteria group bacterium]MCG2719725.1 50S ribosomal protein L10 [Nanoarchaeota archaeon]